MKTNWQPTANIETLRLRAKITAKLREFFHQRDVLEVETPVLGSHTVTDPHIHSICAQYDISGDPSSKMLYLQTSPEFYMKRLLAAGSGAIFQIGKAFRADEMGSQHRPE
ncbi:MAG: amino acid--tRNA ligase-related protein, partial [Gammaproteobacteria bacterium]